MLNWNTDSISLSGPEYPPGQPLRLKKRGGVANVTGGTTESPLPCTHSHREVQSPVVGIDGSWPY